MEEDNLGTNTFDNSETIRENVIRHGFAYGGEFFIVHLMQRKKDGNPRDRFVFTKFVYSIEYWDTRIDEWIDMARQNNARLYINPNRRTNADVLRQMAKDCIDMLDNPHFVLNDFVRSSACSCHKTDDKRWVIDLDFSDIGGDAVFGSESFQCYLSASMRYIIGKNPDAAPYIVRTPNGAHIVTRPFDLREAYDKTTKADVPFDVSKIKKDDMTLVFFEKTEVDGGGGVGGGSDAE